VIGRALLWGTGIAAAAAVAIAMNLALLGSATIPTEPVGRQSAKTPRVTTQTVRTQRAKPHTVKTQTAKAPLPKTRTVYLTTGTELTHLAPSPGLNLPPPRHTPGIEADD